jgi:hypothetical protein
MRVLAPQIFEVDPDESFTVRIDCEGGTYLALGNVNNFELHFNDAMPQADVTPAILAGPGTVNRVHLHLVFTADTPAQRYVIRVIDRNGAVVDLVESILIADEPRPYRIDVDLVAQVVA